MSQISQKPSKKARRGRTSGELVRSAGIQTMAIGSTIMAGGAFNDLPKTARIGGRIAALGLLTAAGAQLFGMPAKAATSPRREDQSPPKKNSSPPGETAQAVAGLVQGGARQAIGASAVGAALLAANPRTRGLAKFVGGGGILGGAGLLFAGEGLRRSVEAEARERGVDPAPREYLGTAVQNYGTGAIGALGFSSIVRAKTPGRVALAAAATTAAIAGFRVLTRPAKANAAPAGRGRGYANDAAAGRGAKGTAAPSRSTGSASRAKNRKGAQRSGFTRADGTQGARLTRAQAAAAIARRK